MTKKAQNFWLAGLQRYGCFLMLCALAMSSGCGGGDVDPEAGMTDDEKQISSTVSSLADIAGRPERLREYFTSDSAPSTADANKMKSYMLSVKGDSINVSGTTATFNVEITTYGESPTASEKSWKAVKEGDKWKISEAPLP